MLFWGRILLEKQSFKKLHLKKIYTASTEMKDTDFKKKHKLYFSTGLYKQNIVQGCSAYHYFRQSKT